MALKPITPYYDGFTGSLTVSEDGGLHTEGRWEVDLEESKLTITELPVGTWIVPYEEFVKEKLMVAGGAAAEGKKRKAGEPPSPEGATSPGGGNPLVLDIFPGSSETSVHIELLCDKCYLLGCLFEQNFHLPTDILETS